MVLSVKQLAEPQSLVSGGADGKYVTQTQLSCGIKGAMISAYQISCGHLNMASLIL